MSKDCNHIVAIHIGHGVIHEEEALRIPKLLEDDCCGGVMKVAFCPLCGECMR